MCDQWRQFLQEQKVRSEQKEAALRQARDEAEAQRKATVQAAFDVERQARRKELEERLAAERRLHEAIVRRAIAKLSALTAAAAVKGARSCEAQKRRRRNKRAKKLAACVGATDAAEDVAKAEARAAAAEREAAALRSACLAGEARVRLARRQARRDVATAGKRALQAVRSSGKASKRKAVAARGWAVTGAERKVARQARKGKRPAAEALHSGDRKRQRLLGGGGKGRGKGGSCGRGGSAGGRGRGWGRAGR